MIAILNGKGIPDEQTAKIFVRGKEPDARPAPLTKLNATAIWILVETIVQVPVLSEVVTTPVTRQERRLPSAL